MVRLAADLRSDRRRRVPGHPRRRPVAALGICAGDVAMFVRTFCIFSSRSDLAPRRRTPPFALSQDTPRSRNASATRCRRRASRFRSSPAFRPIPPPERSTCPTGSAPKGMPGHESRHQRPASAGISSAPDAVVRLLDGLPGRPGPGHRKAAGPPVTSAPSRKHRPEAEPGPGPGGETRLERAAAAAINPHAWRTT